MADLQYAPINVSTLGDCVVIAGNASTPTIQVVGLYFQCNIATTATIKGGSADLTGPMSFVAGGGLNLPANVAAPYFQVNSGANFIIHVGGLTGQCGGAVMYYQF